MNSIERVKAALKFQKPDRVPTWKAGLADVLPLAMLPAKSWRPGLPGHERGLFPFVGDDLAIKLRLWKWDRPDWARAPQFRDWLTLPREEVDEWGAIWNREGQNASMGHPGRPVLADWDDYDHYLSRYHPDPDDMSRYAFFTRLAKLVGGRRYRMAILSFQGPFTTAHAIRGFTDFMMDHALHPAELKRFLGHITDYFLRAARAWQKSGAEPHGFAIFDDLADQTRPFISPAMFREFYEPVFRALIDEAHRMGREFHLHSCGKIDALLPILLDWGLDAIQLDSPRQTGYPALAPFRGRIMFWGDVNIQTIYTRGTPDEVEREVWHMVRNLGTPEGGFGAYFYPQVNHIRAPRANVRAFNRGVKKFGTYRRIPAHWWTHPVPDKWDENIAPPLPPGDR